MKLIDALDWIRTSVLSQRHRNTLTITGFAIGVSTITLLAALGDSLKTFVVAEFTQFGSNIVAVTPGKTETMGVSGILRTNKGLYLEDVASLQHLPQVEKVIPVIAGTAEVKHANRLRATDIIGTNHFALAAWQLQQAQGRFLPNDDLYRPRPVAVLGSKIHQALFENTHVLGEFIRIGGQRFTVVGVLAPKGQFLGMDLDEMVYVPAAKGLELFNRDSLMEVDIVYRSHLSPPQAVSAIKLHLIKRHGAEDFTIVTQDQMLDTMAGILTAIRITGIIIGAISLLVGSVGIYTILTITISQRQQEVGLVRALGMPQRLLMLLFLGEALTLALIGGILGLLTVAVLQGLLFYWLPELPTLLTLSSAGLGLSVSLLVGLLSGARPAYMASRLPPIEALRAE
ncbi:Macrolide export ATP-binding/permease protein MacB [Saliniradius amylolyticus]|uniref:Macrolide export ATP-binding/permease protein MacB n=1 Tax=Saliniradius amylolyticus TaxID=2183582 RepID=A0A2S2E4F1_9ALTE|nr:ABC transporter permease [Saliniradius amylolyticus]AWL12469.1 Macrolide export ATP-binding/permease protein MacB [Saliniradius amylolyticus]